MRYPRMAALVLALSSACSNVAADDCRPAVFETSLPNADARASTDDGIEVWGLFYPSEQDVEGQPVAIELQNVSSPDDEEPRRGTKIVWRATGDGDFSVVASSPDGVIFEPFWLEAHGGSNWDRPGDEWGILWELSELGCWTFTVRRGAASAQISIEVTGV
jgi:hypothetical protein